jgi:hypothetical protein
MYDALTSELASGGVPHGSLTPMASWLRPSNEVPAAIADAVPGAVWTADAGALTVGPGAVATGAALAACAAPGVTVREASAATRLSRGD